MKEKVKVMVKLLAGVAVWAVLAAVSTTFAAETKRPNIIFILADDYGIPGVGCYGGPYKTPNLDRLAAGGMRFEHCFSAPLCAPSRAMCMFGRYAFRTGVLTNGYGAAATPQSEVCIAKVLKQAGYATAVAGKWSQLTLMSTPEEAKAWGVDEFLCWDKGQGDRYWKPALSKNGQTVPVTDTSYAPDLLHEFVIDFIRRHRDGPFFVHYPMTLIHAPIMRTPDSRSGEPTKGRKDGPLYGENIAYMDKLVGKLVAALDEMKLRENTLVVFTGDNGSAGGTMTIGGRPVDGRKSKMLEGGSRVPLIASWKGTMPAGKVSKDLVDFSDFFPTFAELAGAKLPAGVTIDGHSFAPQLRGQSGAPREWVYVQLGPNCYVRDHAWKLNQSGELFDMKDAPFAEKLVAPDPKDSKAAEARQRLAAALAELNPAAGKTAEPKQKNKERKKEKRQRKREKQPV